MAAQTQLPPSQLVLIAWNWCRLLHLLLVPAWKKALSKLLQVLLVQVLQVQVLLLRLLRLLQFLEVLLPELLLRLVRLLLPEA